MWGHYLITLYRSLTRHRLYAALNVLSLAIGIAVFLVLWLDVRFETSFERWIPKASTIYQLRTTSLAPGYPPQGIGASMGGVLEELRTDYPGLLGTRDWARPATVRKGADANAEQLDLVDPSFFRVFDLPLARGDKTHLLQAPDEVVMTQAKARTYFGTTDVVGRRLIMVVDGKETTYRITGVLKDLPRDTDLQFDFLAVLTPQMAASEPGWRHWGSQELTTYLDFDRPEQARAFNAEMDRFADRHAGKDITPGPAHKYIRLRAEPLTAMHLWDPKAQAVVAAIGAVGLLTMLLAAVNYVNLATARAGLRAREVAMRKVMGATGEALVGQFLGEAMLTALLSALIGVALAELSLPLINTAGGLALKIDYLSADGLLLPVLLAVVLIGLGAGVYPALMLSRFRPASVLASSQMPGGGRGGGRVREALVLVQFTIAIAFTVATGVIVSQTAYLRRADLGFERTGLIVVPNFDSGELTTGQRANLLSAWRALPGVSGATAGTIAPGVQHLSNTNTMQLAGKPGDGPPLNIVQTRPDFFRVYGARLLAGRLLDVNHGGDDHLITTSPLSPNPTPTLVNAVINKTALGIYGFRTPADALGKVLSDAEQPARFTIVGVVDDLHFLSPHEPVRATAYLLGTGEMYAELAGVRYAGAAPGAVRDAMRGEWRRLAPGVPFRADTIEDRMQRYYKADDQHGRLFTIGAMLAVAIGCVGLYGLASFSAARRVREIGIRKTLGASTADILRLLIGQFLRPVLLANLIAWPLAWLAMRSWLASFEQRVELGPVYFVGASLLALVIALLTIAGQTWRVARAEPARALRQL